jgi:hypothetical protein
MQKNNFHFEASQYFTEFSSNSSKEFAAYGLIAIALEQLKLFHYIQSCDQEFFILHKKQ